MKKTKKVDGKVYKVVYIGFRSPVIYKYTTTGKIQQWQIFTDKDKFYTVEGIKGGKLTTSKPTICEGKNTGKRNQTSPCEQAAKEAKAKYQKKLDGGYNEVLTKSTKFEPMLAESARDVETAELEPWFEKLMQDKSIKKFVQPKLDGIRSLNEKNTLLSREGNPFTTCPHLYQNEVTLDGELYNHDFKADFNAIVSLIKRETPDKEAIEKAKELAQMWVYDFPRHKGKFSERYKALEAWFKAQKNPAFVLVPTYSIETMEDLERYHKQFKEQGYEGTIIRVDKNDYENKRTKQLIKYKDFIDSEFQILGYIEGKGARAGTIGKFILAHDKVKGQTFKCNVKGKFEYLRKVWKNRDTYVGKTATVKYHNRTPLKEGGKGDVPRFGYVIKIDRESYE